VKRAGIFRHFSSPCNYGLMIGFGKIYIKISNAFSDDPRPFL